MGRTKGVEQSHTRSHTRCPVCCSPKIGNGGMLRVSLLPLSCMDRSTGWPVMLGSRANLHMVYDRIPFDLVPAAIRYERGRRYRLLLRAGQAEHVSLDPGAAGLHHGHVHVAVFTVRDVPHRVFAQRIVNPAIRAFGFETRRASRSQPAGLLSCAAPSC